MRGYYAASRFPVVSIIIHFALILPPISSPLIPLAIIDLSNPERVKMSFLAGQGATPPCWAHSRLGEYYTAAASPSAIACRRQSTAHPSKTKPTNRLCARYVRQAVESAAPSSIHAGLYHHSRAGCAAQKDSMLERAHDWYKVRPCRLPAVFARPRLRREAAFTPAHSPNLSVSYAKEPRIAVGAENLLRSSGKDIIIKVKRAATLGGEPPRYKPETAAQSWCATRRQSGKLNQSQLPPSADDSPQLNDLALLTFGNLRVAIGGATEPHSSTSKYEFDVPTSAESPVSVS